MASSSQSLLLPIEGEFPVEPEIRLQPTVQRAAPVANVGWKWRRRYTIVNTASEPLANFPLAIDLGLTNGIVTGTKAQADGDDLRVRVQGREVARTLVDWNSATFTTLCWVVIPYLGVGESMVFDVVYGNTAATTPPTLTAGVDLPAFDIQTAGANRSTNAKWVYQVARTVGNAGKGGAWLSSGVAQPEVRHSVPGAWQPANTLQTDDARWQEPYSTYVATGTKYQFRFEARRATPGSLLVGQGNGLDGVSLRLPIGIVSVRSDIVWTNMAIGDTDLTPIGKVVIVTRNAPSESWATLYSNAALQATEATIASATRTPAAPVKEVAYAVWPQAGNNIDLAAKPDRFINAAWGAVLEVVPNSAAITQTLTEAEVEVYELATELRSQGGGDAVGIPPYKSIFLGNAKQVAGVGTPRLACKLNEIVRVFTATRKVEIWNSALTAKVEDVPIPAVSAVDGVLLDDGTTVERPSSEWMPLLPMADPLTNSSADVDALNWTTPSGTAGITKTLTRVTTPVDSAPGTFRLNVSANTAGASAFTETYATDYLPVGNRKSVQLGIAVQVGLSDFRPRPRFIFYDQNLTAFLSASALDYGAPVVSTWHRRLFAARVPEGAVFYRVGVRLVINTAGAIGDLWFDTVAVNDTEIALLDVASGTLVLSAQWTPRYAYA